MNNCRLAQDVGEFQTEKLEVENDDLNQKRVWMAPDAKLLVFKSATNIMVRTFVVGDACIQQPE